MLKKQKYLIQGIRSIKRIKFDRREKGSFPKIYLYQYVCYVKPQLLLIFLNHLPVTVGWYAVSPLRRKSGTLYRNEILWEQSNKTVRKLTHY